MRQQQQQQMLNLGSGLGGSGLGTSGIGVSGLGSSGLGGSGVGGSSSLGELRRQEMIAKRIKGPNSMKSFELNDFIL